MTLSAKTVTSRVGRFPKWFGRVPAAVLIDLTVSSHAVRVFGILALKTLEGNISVLGCRELGKLIGKSRSTALRYIGELVSAGHLEIVPSANGHRSSYRLLSQVFIEEPKSKPIIKACSKCGQVSKLHRNTGWCDPCKVNAREDKRRAGIESVSRGKITA